MEPNKHNHLLLEALKNNPNVTQRDLAQEVGISLGKVNYCLQALIEKGWIKVGNFKRSNNKLGYIYLLTPKGIEEKIKLTKNYLARKLVEYEDLEAEIKVLKEQLEQ